VTRGGLTESADNPFNLSDDLPTLKREYEEMRTNLGAATARFEADPSLADVKASIEESLPLMEAYEAKIARLEKSRGQTA
jgi:hypothetical protein